MNKINRFLIFFMLCCGLVKAGFTQNIIADYPKIEQYHRNENEAAVQKLRRLQRGEAVKFRIVQLGDSHTAGGFFTDKLRRILQQKWGDGGLGVFYPNQIKYQRISGINFNKNHWHTLTSRKDAADFPLGGVLTRSEGDLPLIISPNLFGLQTVSVLAKPVLAQNLLQLIDSKRYINYIAVNGSSDWRWTTFQAAAPISIYPSRDDLWQIGLIQMENQSDKGIVVSALGINGAQWAHSQKWRADWPQDLAATRADLLILAYGTNEAFQPALNIAETELFWRNKIAEIRQKLPESMVLIVGAPESLSDTSGECGTRPSSLNEVQTMQRRVAQETGVWFWSWQDAMGGECSMNRWRQQGLAGKDGVHFTADGYARSGALLAKALSDLAE